MRRLMGQDILEGGREGGGGETGAEFSDPSN